MLSKFFEALKALFRDESSVWTEKKWARFHVELDGHPERFEGLLDSNHSKTKANNHEEKK